MMRFVAIPLVLIVWGCGSSPATHFYTLDPVAPGRGGRPGISEPVQVVAVHMPPLLDREEIVRESASNKIAFTSENRWGAPLDEMVRRVLTQDLSDRLPQGSVVLPNDPTPPNARKIVVSVLQFQSDPSGGVVLDGSWSLLKLGAEVPALTRPVYVVEQSGASDYGSQVKAMSQAIGDLADQISTSLAERKARVD